MDYASVWYLAVTVGLFLCLAGIAARLFRRGNRERAESAKYRMLEEE